MRAGDHGMVRLRNQHPFLLSLTPPQHEDDWGLLRRNEFDHPTSELLPTTSLMRTGLMRPHREDGVEHKDSLPSPRFKIPIIRNLTAKVFMEFLIDISQRERQRPNGRGYGETEPMGMARGGIGVLADEQNPDLLIRCHG